MNDMGVIQTIGTPELHIFCTGTDLNILQALKHIDLQIANDFSTHYVGTNAQTNTWTYPPFP